MRYVFYFIGLYLAAFSNLNAKTATATDDCQFWLACQQAVNVALPADGCTVVLDASYLAQTASACGPTPIMEVVNPGPYTIGTHNFTVRARVGSQSKTCSGQVTIEDKTAPQVTCFDQQIFTADPVAAFNAANMIESVDNCDAEPLEIAPIDNAIGYGTFDHNWSSIDDSGNTSSCVSRTTLRPFNESYCTPNSNSRYEYINRLRVNGLGNNDIDNTSGNNNGYGYYVNHEARVGMGRSFRVQANAGGSNTINLSWEVFIDLNSDGDFNDAGERMHQSSGNNPNLDINITIPANFTYTGKRRMRVFLQYDRPGGACQAGRYGYGEYEDYLLDIRFTIWNPWSFRSVAEEEIADAKDINNVSPQSPIENVANPAATGTAATNHRIYPNPAAANTAVRLELGDGHGLHYLSVRNGLGQEVAHLAVLENGAHTIEIPANLTAGFYVVNGLDADKRPVWAERLIVR